MLEKKIVFLAGATAPPDPPLYTALGSHQKNVWWLFVTFTYLEIVVNVLSLYKTPNKNMSVCLSVCQLDNSKKFLQLESN